MALILSLLVNSPLLLRIFFPHLRVKNLSYSSINTNSFVQISASVADLTVKCAREVRCVDLSQDGDLKLFKPLLLEKPDIVVVTPSKALAHIKANHLKLKTGLEMLVIDEADLIFSFGYEDEIKELLRYLLPHDQYFFPKASQTQ